MTRVLDADGGSTPMASLSGDRKEDLPMASLSGDRKDDLPMAVYVDDAKNPFGRMIMSHMIADTRTELDDMAARIELKQVHKQNVGELREHFDVSQNYRSKAIHYGARFVSQRVLVTILHNRVLEDYLR